MKFLKKILLVDHEPHVTQLIKRALEKTGSYNVRVERNGSFATHAARWLEPDLVLLDAPVGGPEAELVARQFAAEAKLTDTPVIALSNLVGGLQLLSGGMLTGYSFVAAPVSIEEVVRAIDALLEKPSLRAAA